MLISFNPNYSNPQFQQKPNSAQMKKYTESVTKGLNVLNKNIGLIIHNSSVPSLPKQNIGIGSLLSKAAQLSFLPFVVANGFNTIQQEPDSIRSTYVPSPYSPISSSKNAFMIPIERLASEEYGFLLDNEDISAITLRNSKEPNTVNFSKTKNDFDTAIAKAHSTLVQELDEVLYVGMDKNTRLKHIQLKNDFEQFKKTHRKELEPNAIYEVLAKKYNNEQWRTWPQEDQKLYQDKNTERINFINKKYANEIDLHFFKQWILDREINNANKRNDNLGLKVVGDSPIAFTPVEEWMNQDLFLENWALGCPPDYFSKNGQRWGFAVLKPETIFNPDGSLGEGGKLMQKRYEKMFATSPGGARIDHIIGLIDPYVYRIDEPTMNDNNSGRLYSSPNHPVLNKYTKHTEEEYSAILEKIVIPAAEKYGISKNDIICEDLGTLTKPVINVMNHKNLSGIAVTQFDYRGKDTPEKNIIMPGSHDNESFLEYANNIFKEKIRLAKKSYKLAQDTKTPDENLALRTLKIFLNKTKFIEASFAELFTSPAKKIQLFFTTFFGMDKTYNKPGSTKDCWTLRAPENYDEMYWENVKNGTAPNLPEIIARAIRHKGNDFAKENKSLLSNLDELANILKK